LLGNRNLLGDIDSLFYDLDKNVEVCLLDKMHQDYMQVLQNQQKGSARNSLNENNNRPQANYDYPTTNIDEMINENDEGDMIEEFTMPLTLQRNSNPIPLETPNRISGRMRDFVNQIMEPVEVSEEELDLMTLPLLKK